jgi:YVTN family beta-propeller protein
MQIPRWLSFFGLLSLWAVCLSCGQNYRLPIIQIPGDPGDPKLYHFAMTISTNDPVADANVPGTVMQADVVGDMDVGEAPVGRGPIFATLLPTGSANRIYVVNGLEETVSTTTAAPQSCSPGPVCPIGTVSTITMPAGSVPSYLNSTEASNMYVILQNLNRLGQGVSAPPSVGVISVFQNSLQQEIVLPAGHPAAMVELPNGHKLYVVDQTNNAVYVVNTLSRQIEQTLVVGPAPSMAIASPDNAAVYVMTNSGVSVIDALTDMVIGNLPTAAQPNSIAYDTKLSRLYTTDTAGQVGVYDAATAGGTLPTMLTVLLLPTDNAGRGPIGVAPLADGSRFYVLSIDPDHATTPLGTSLTLTAVDSKTLVLPNPLIQFSMDPLNPPLTQGAPPVPAAVVPYCTSVRFRYMVGASADSGRVYVSSCDAGGTYIFRTSDNTGVFLLPSPNQPPILQAGQPVYPRQNPVFLITGR